jgi:ABC-type dipeptide/oligopeptide/nickel transport system permease subunit
MKRKTKQHSSDVEPAPGAAGERTGTSGETGETGTTAAGLSGGPASTATAEPTATPAAGREQAAEGKTVGTHHGPAYYAVQRFLDNRSAVVSGIVLTLLLLMAIFAPLIAKTGYQEQAFLQKVFAFPSWEHPFGVDPVGRDFFSRVIYGARVSIGVGVSSAVISLIIGLPLGAIAGFRGGTFDWVVMRLVEIFSVVPPLLVAIIIAALIGGGVINIVLISSAFLWVHTCRLVRGQVMAYKKREFIQASRALGASSRYIIRKHLIPNSVSPIIVGFVLAIPRAMMIEASLSFLGVGINPPIPSWGQMISEGLDYMFFYWHLAVFPTLFLAITVLTTTLFGDGLRDAVDPTMKGK